jgi:hypothetical protein
LISGDLFSFIGLIASEDECVFGGIWFNSIVSDMLFFIEPNVREIRDVFLNQYARFLATSGVIPLALGTRLAVDISGTLSNEKAATQSAEMFIGRLSSSTKDWLLATKLAHDKLPGSSLPESLCLERFHRNVEAGRLVDALHTLVVAAEVGPDVHMGACRISDYLDANNGKILSEFQKSNLHSIHVMPRKSLLPEYIESGRFELLCDLVEKSDLVKIIASPNCPPEMILRIATEIKASHTKLTLDESAAVCLSLLNVPKPETGHAETLMAWFGTELAKSSLL